MPQNNTIFVISGPSGSGQDSVIAELKKIIDIESVVTTTTRLMRPGEEQGKPYYFISKDEFEQGIKANKYIEFAKEYNYYGVTAEEIERVKNSGKIGLWKVEYQGAITAKKLFPGIKAILITAPLDILEQRIRQRDNATEVFVQDRMKYTKEFLEHRNIYDYEIENVQGKLEKTVRKVQEIIQNNI